MNLKPDGEESVLKGLRYNQTINKNNPNDTNDNETLCRKPILYSGGARIVSGTCCTGSTPVILTNPPS